MTGTGIVFIGGGKGGVGKSATSHLVCLGAILHNEPSAYVLTDPNRRMRGEGRPYGVLDGRDPQRLANILSVSRNGFNGWVIIDGGGNRPAFDLEIAAAADLCILPFRASEETWTRSPTISNAFPMPSRGRQPGRRILTRREPRSFTLTGCRKLFRCVLSIVRFRL